MPVGEFRRATRIALVEIERGKGLFRDRLRFHGGGLRDGVRGGFSAGGRWRVHALLVAVGGHSDGVVGLGLEISGTPTPHDNGPGCGFADGYLGASGQCDHHS